MDNLKTFEEWIFGKKELTPDEEREIKVGDTVRYHKLDRNGALSDFFDNQIGIVKELFDVEEHDTHSPSKRFPRGDAKVMFDKFFTFEFGNGTTKWFITPLEHLEKVSKEEYNDYLEEEKRRKEEMKFVDPYGEEEWKS